MGKVNPKEHYRRMNANIPTLSIRLEKEKMAKFDEIAKKLEIPRSVLGRGIVNSILKDVEEKKLKINSNNAKGTISLKFTDSL